MKLIDSHCHVHFNAYKSDMDDVIKEALDKGVFMITVGTQKDTSAKGLEVAEQYDGVWATVGLHPNHLIEQSFWDEEEVAAEDQATPKIHTRAERFDADVYRELAKHPKCVAIGEVGLDWYRVPEGVDLEEMKQVQEENVRLHFDLATELELPVIIHCRDAYDEQADLIEEYVNAGKLQKRGVMHCYGGTEGQMQRFLDLGFMIGFTGIVTFEPKKREADERGLSEIQRVVKSIPLDRILLETDSPYITPVPFRGQRNEPKHVREVAEMVAKLKRIEIEEIWEITAKNTIDLFGLDI
jgi:TatD DNase family protein